LRFDTRQITIAGVLAALTLVLGMTPLGFIRVPTLAGAVTIMHLPVIMAGILGGPAIGVAVGLIFGILTVMQFWPYDPRVLIPARVLIGPIAFLICRALRNTVWGLPLAAVGGSAVNTVGTLGLAVVFGWIPLAGKEGALGIALIHGVPEAIVSALVVTPIVLAVNRAMQRSRFRR
jgi:uncharacterized membrane protein